MPNQEGPFKYAFVSISEGGTRDTSNEYQADTWADVMAHAFRQNKFLKKFGHKIDYINYKGPNDKTVRSVPFS